MERFDFGPPDSAVVSFSCPHCGHANADDFELVDPDQVQAVRCDGCGRDFHAVLMECPRCAADSTYQWTQAPGEQALSGLACRQCGQLFANDAESADEALG